MVHGARDERHGRGRGREVGAAGAMESTLMGQLRGMRGGAGAELGPHPWEAVQRCRSTMVRGKIMGGRQPERCRSFARPRRGRGFGRGFEREKAGPEKQSRKSKAGKRSSVERDRSDRATWVGVRWGSSRVHGRETSERDRLEETKRSLCHWGEGVFRGCCRCDCRCCDCRCGPCHADYSLFQLLPVHSTAVRRVLLLLPAAACLGRCGSVLVRCVVQNDSQHETCL